MKTRDLNTAVRVFRQHGGMLRTRDLIALGIHTDALYALRERDQVVELGRGLYHLADASEPDHPDLTVVAACAPNAAICLISAVSYHGITTQIPSSVHVAVPRGNYHGIKLSIPVTVYRVAPETFTEGVDTRTIGGMPLKIYNAARTVVDCFKFRNKIGVDVALEALRLARQRKRVQNPEVLHYARLLRVANFYLRIYGRSNEHKGTENVAASVLPRLRDHAERIAFANSVSALRLSLEYCNVCNSFWPIYAG